MKTQDILDLQEWFTLRRQMALAGKLGGQKGIEQALGDSDVVILPRERRLFDKTGRANPLALCVPEDMTDENQKFNVKLPEEIFLQVYRKAATHLPSIHSRECEVSDGLSSIQKKYIDSFAVGEFFKRAKPIVLPQHDARKDYGKSFEEIFLPLVAKRCNEIARGRGWGKFKNLYPGMTGKIRVVPECGQEQLLAAMAEDIVPAWYSPNPFQGWPVDAQRKALKTLRKYGNFALAGGIETAVAYIMYTDEMMRDHNTPLYECSAISPKEGEGSFSFFLSDYQVRFSRFNTVKRTDNYWSGGLVLFG